MKRKRLVNINIGNFLCFTKLNCICTFLDYSIDIELVMYVKLDKITMLKRTFIQTKCLSESISMGSTRQRLTRLLYSQQGQTFHRRNIILEKTSHFNESAKRIDHTTVYTSHSCSVVAKMATIFSRRKLTLQCKGPRPKKISAMEFYAHRLMMDEYTYIHRE